MSTSVHFEGLLQKLSSGMFGKWQDRQVVITNSGITQRKANADASAAKSCVRAEEIASVQLKDAKDGCEIHIALLDSKDSEYVLKAPNSVVAQQWADNINIVSPAGQEKLKKEAEEKAAVAKSEAEAEAKAKEAEAKAKEAEAKAQAQAAEAAVKKDDEVFDNESNVDLESFITCFTGLTEHSDDAKNQRHKAWLGADPNGNGYCSLAEIDGWIQTHLLSQKEDKDEADRLWQQFRPCYIRAFSDAADAMADKRVAGTATATTDDYVQRQEFRLLCSYLCIYARMFHAFTMIDGGSIGTTKDDDRRISKEEWLAGSAKVTGHGFVALSTFESADEIFDAMDADGKGMVLLDEWCAHLKTKEQEAGTQMGNTLSIGDEDITEIDVRGSDDAGAVAKPKEEAAPSPAPSPEVKATKQAAVISKPKPTAPRSSPVSTGDGSVFDRLSTSYTGTSKHRRKAINTQRGFRGMDGHVSRSAGTGTGKGSWLDVGMEETKNVEYDTYSHNTVGSDARGGCMSKLSVGRFQTISETGHFRSKADLEESAQRDIECVDKSTFSQFASNKSQFGTHSGMGMGGKIGNRFGHSITATGHFRSRRDLEDDAKRDYMEEGSIFTSSFGGAQKSMTTKTGMSMGGAIGNRFQITDSAGRIRSNKDLEDAAKRDFLNEESAVGTSTFASALKRGNPNFTVMGGKTGRFAGSHDSMYKKPVNSKGPGDYQAEDTYNLLPMPARTVMP